MARLHVVAVCVVVALVAVVDAEISNYRGLDLVDGARCWGPGVWPHPSHCRLFSVCRLQEHEVVGTLVACPVGTGFSSRHLRCVDANTVPGCRNSTPPAAMRSVLVLSANTTRRHQCSYDGVSYCESDSILVVCAPNQRLLGRVDCNEQKSDSVEGRCDEHHDATCLYTTQEKSDLLALEDKSMGFDLEVTEPNTTVPTPVETTTPQLESVSLISPDTFCQRVGLHCLDAQTLVDCEEEGSAPTFSISCAEVMTSDSRAASGRCVAGVCQLALDGVRLNLELATLDFGDDEAVDRVSALLDEDDDEGLPEMMDTELLRGSPASGWGWFRNSAENEDTNNATSVEVAAVSEEVDETTPTKDNGGPLSWRTNEDTNNATSVEVAAVSEEVDETTPTKDNGGPLSWRTNEVGKVPRRIRVQSENSTATAQFAERCARGGLVCLDETTLVACSGDDVDTPTYAILCAGTARGGNVTLTARCDLQSDSCQLDSH